MRGEKTMPIGAYLKISGSPPHTRGKGHHPVVVVGRRGITPAYAGKRMEKNFA